MKFKHILLICLILLAMVTVTAVSAADDSNSTDVGVGDESPVVEDEGIDVVSAGDDDVEIDLDDEETFVIGDEDYIDVDIPEDTSAKLSVKVNGTLANLTTHTDDEDIIVDVSLGGKGKPSLSLPLQDDDDEDITSYSISLDKLNPGIYNIEVIVKTTTTYTKSSVITLVSESSAPDVVIDFQDDNSIDFEFPDDEIGRLTVLIDGNTSKLRAVVSEDDDSIIYVGGAGATSTSLYLDGEEESEYIISLENLDPGTYNITVNFKMDGKTYSNSSIVTLGGGIPPALDVEIEFDGDDSITLEFPEDTNGTLSVNVDGSDYNLSVGNDGVIYVGDVGTNLLALPLNGEDENEYEISLENLPLGTYNVTVIFKINGQEYSNSSLVTLGGETPADLDVEITFEDDNSITLEFPDDVSGTLTVRINGTDANLAYDSEEEVVYVRKGNGNSLVLPVNGEDENEYEISLDKLPSGTYNVTVIFNINGKEYSNSSVVTVEGETQEDLDVEITFEDDNSISLEIPEDVSGTLTVNVNGTDSLLSYDNGIIYAGEGSADSLVLPVNGKTEYKILVGKLPSGTYNVTVVFKINDDEYSNSSVMTVGGETPLDLDVEITFGDDNSISLEIPQDVSGTLTVKVNSTDSLLSYDNGIIYAGEGSANSLVLPVSGKNEYAISIDKLPSGTYNITVVFTANSKEYSNSSVMTVKGETQPDLDIKTDFDGYNTINIEFPRGISGSLSVKVNGIDYNLTYDDDESVIYVGKGSKTSITLPVSGEDDNEYEISLEKLTSGTYNVTVVFTVNGKAYSNSSIMEVEGNDPHDYDVDFDFDDKEFIIGEDDTISIEFPEDVDGTLSVKINGTLYKLSVVTDDDESVIYVGSSGKTSLDLPLDDEEENSYEISLDNLGPGTYNVTVIFEIYGQEYSESAIIKVMRKDQQGSDVKIYFDDEDEDEFVYTIGYEDYITVEFLKTASGTLTVKINGTAVKLTTPKENEDGELMIYASFTGTGQTSLRLSDEEDEEYFICLDRLGAGVYDVEVTFQNSNGKTVKSDIITVVGEDYWQEEEQLVLAEVYIYHSPDSIIRIPEKMAPNIRVLIDNKLQQIKNENGIQYVDLTAFDLGKYAIVIYNGTEVLFNTTFSVGGVIQVPMNMTYKSSRFISLILPENATGNLTIKLNDELIFNQKLINGTISYSLAGLVAGGYDLEAKYTGSDFDVKSVSEELEVYPIITYPSRMTVGQNKYLTIECGGNVNALVRIEADGDPYKTVKIVNGFAKVPLSGLEDGDVELTVIFQDDINGLYISEEMYFDVEILEVPVRFVGAKDVKMRYGDSVTYKVTIYGTNGKPIEADEYVEVTIGKKTFAASVDKKGVASLRIPVSVAPGKYKIKVDYDDKIVTKKITIKHLLKFKKVKIKKSAKKLVLKASLKKKMKGQKIIFKFKGKKYVRKTNKKGVAKLVIKKKVLKKLKVGKKVKYQASYKRDVIKRKAKVKK